MEDMDFTHVAIINVDSNIGSIVGNTLDDIICEDRSGNVITINKSDVNTEIARLQAEYDALAYSRARAIAYASQEDQADQQYWDLVNGTTTWKDAIAKVKSDNPKE